MLKFWNLELSWNANLGNGFNLYVCIIHIYEPSLKFLELGTVGTQIKYGFTYGIGKPYTYVAFQNLQSY